MHSYLCSLQLLLKLRVEISNSCSVDETQRAGWILSEQGSTRKRNKNTCEEEPSDSENAGQNKETYKCFLIVVMTIKLGCLYYLTLEKNVENKLAR